MEETKDNKPAEKRAWYVLRAISGKEAKVKEVLDAAIRNSDLGKYVFTVTANILALSVISFIFIKHLSIFLQTSRVSQASAALLFSAQRSHR